MTRAVGLADLLKRIKSDDERFGFAVALLGHAILLIVLTINLSDEIKPPAMSQALAVDIVDGSDLPMFGDPTGNEAPPPTVEPQPQLDEQVEENRAPEPEPEPVQPMEEAPTEPEKVEQPAQPTQNTSSPDQTSTPNPSERTGSGRIAFGAQIKGLGGGMDGDLAAAIAKAVVNQISACWDAPRDNAPDNIAITMVVDFDPTGHLIGEPKIIRLVDEQEILVEDPSNFEIAAIEAARRCNPVHLQPSLYRYWRQVHVQIFSDVLPEQIAQQGQSSTGSPAIGL